MLIKCRKYGPQRVQAVVVKSRCSGGPYTLRWCCQSHATVVSILRLLPFCQTFFPVYSILSSVAVKIWPLMVSVMVAWWLVIWTYVHLPCKHLRGFVLTFSVFELSKLYTATTSCYRQGHLNNNRLIFVITLRSPIYRDRSNKWPLVSLLFDFASSSKIFVILLLLNL